MPRVLDGIGPQHRKKAGRILTARHLAGVSTHHDHDEIPWLTAEEWTAVNWMPANIPPTELIRARSK